MWHILILLSISPLPTQTMFCPSSCMCNQDGAVKCVGSISDVPKLLPSNTYLLQLSKTNMRTLNEFSLADLPLMLRFRISHSLNTIHPKAFHVASQLLSVKLSSNNLTSLPPRVFSPLLSLEQLHLDGNRLESIAPVLFQGLASLKELDISHNAIAALEPDVFGSLSDLRFLNLGRNSIRELPPTIFHSLTHLQYLSIYNNQLDRIEAGAFDELANLIQLKLHHNQIASLPPEVFWALGNLDYLSLSSNKLQGVPEKTFYRMPKLAKLTLYNNPLLSLPGQLMGHMPLMKEFYLYGTNLTTVPWNLFSNMSSLRNLSFHLNDKLRELHLNLFCCLPRLQKLSLKANDLQELDSDLFSRLSNMTTLILNNNKLHRLPEDIFSGLPELVTIELRNNHLTTLSRDVFSSNEGLRAVTLSGNPWDCTCSIRGIAAWIRRNEGVVSDGKDVMCHSPLYQVLRTLGSLSDKEFSICDATTPLNYRPTNPSTSPMTKPFVTKAGVIGYKSSTIPTTTPTSTIIPTTTPNTIFTTIPMNTPTTTPNNIPTITPNIPTSKTITILTTTPTTISTMTYWATPDIELLDNSDNLILPITEALPAPLGDSRVFSSTVFYDRLVVDQGPEFVHNNRRKGWVYVWSLPSDVVSGGFLMVLHILLVATGVVLILATIYGTYRLQQAMADLASITHRKHAP